MTDRVRFITHQGKSILLVDLSHCSAVELEKATRGILSLVEYVVHLTHEFLRKEWLFQNVCAVFSQSGKLITKARYKQELRFGVCRTNPL